MKYCIDPLYNKNITIDIALFIRPFSLVKKPLNANDKPVWILQNHPSDATIGIYIS